MSNVEKIDLMTALTASLNDSRCPGCRKGKAPVVLDEHGTLTSVSGEPGKPGHAVDDFFWFCEDYATGEARDE